MAQEATKLTRLRTLNPTTLEQTGHCPYEIRHTLYKDTPVVVPRSYTCIFTFLACSYVLVRAMREHQKGSLT